MSVSETTTLPKTQSAITISEFGSAEVLQYHTQVAVPELAANQVMVKVAYASVNPVDYKTRLGLGWGAENIKNNQFAKQQPAILGFDMAGEVVASNADGFNIGDRVAALNFSGGCYAEYNVVDAELLAKVPNEVDLKSAGAVPCVGTTAYQMLKFADIKSGEHVVMNAPAGGVGHLAVQMLLDKVEKQGIKLTLICSPDKYHKLQNVIDTSKLAGWIDYSKQADFPSLDADILLDLVGNDAGVQALSTLKQNARVVVLPSIWVDKLKQAGADKNIQVEGFIATPNGSDLQTVLNMLNDGSVKLHIQTIYPLVNTQEAHKAIEKGNTFGKILLEV